MALQGLQKLTLLDYPGRVACTVFFGGCNFRCPFCHNAGLVRGSLAPELGEEELLAYLKKRRGVLEGVCVSGGEPLLEPGLADLLERVKALGYAVKLDTNGSFPHRLRQLVGKGLVDTVAMDIKNSPEGYARTAGVPGLDLAPIRESAAFLLGGGADYELRTTVAAGLHTEADFVAIGEWLAGAKRYFLQRFVDSGDVLEPGLSAPGEEEMRRYLAALQKNIPAARIRGG
ncbi:anaerobic ribonucleoside-triphosphate reductase activating protein [Allofournierella sp.]|uniref:anaerobic ribonucleoside-triphosphate reductase activating protein n=1 Tax=Allofournierella sp. TaxID=1940256 RepID=UPI003AF00077